MVVDSLLFNDKMTNKLIKIKNYINGKLINPIDEKYIENVTPITGQVYSLIPDSDYRDVDLAVESAKNAFKKMEDINQKTKIRSSNEIGK